MDWMRLEKALTAWSARYRPRLGRVVGAKEEALRPTWEEVRDAALYVRASDPRSLPTLMVVACARLSVFVNSLDADARRPEFHAEEQSLYEALDCKVENLRLAERVDALERLAIVAERAAVGRAGGYWTEIRQILDELKRET